MAQRRRRTGYRPGQLSAGLARAMGDEAAGLRAVQGAVARIDAVTQAIAAVEEALDEFREVRLDAVVALRHEGWSYDQVAAAASLSKSRVKQLVHEARGRGLLDAERRAAPER